ncbi:MAG: hypothetical protein HZC37_04740 [Burkholderiales bacterium]|nr:hypothetical protein [Burkholderiales bacterium]
MPGWYIHLNAARRAIDALETNANSAPLFGANGPTAAQVKGIAKANPTYTALGAIGPDIFFLLPDFKPPVGSMLWKLATSVRDLYEFWDEHFLGPYESAMGPIGNNRQDEINALTGGLQSSIEGIFKQAFAFLNDTILKLILEQYDFFGLLSSGVPAGHDEQSFFWSDMLHYRETYRFGAALWQRAGDANVALSNEQRERFKAFALGWMTHLATDVSGHGLVNQKAGGPFRLHWQRHHLIENHLDAQVYNADNGGGAIYNEVSNSALHLWLAFNPDGSSRVDFFDAMPNPPYPPGDSGADITDRHAVWDVDSDMPEDLAQFLSDTLKAVYEPSLAQNPKGMAACCPTIISSLDNRVPLATSGYAEKADIVGAYYWLFKYVKWTTTDYYKVRRPVAPQPFVIPSHPRPPGSGDSDPGPGATDNDSFWDDVLDLLLSLLAWAEYLTQLAVWPAALVLGIIAGTVTYPLRLLLYEYLELPLYNLWLAVHTYLAMTGYVLPMSGEINRGLTTLGVSVSDDWRTTVAALGDPDGGLVADVLSTDAKAAQKQAYPKDVLIDHPNVISAIFSMLFKVGAPPRTDHQLPSEFTRPWRYPERDNANNPVNLELPRNLAGPYLAGMDATAFFGAQPGSNIARAAFERCESEEETIQAARKHLPKGEHLGDPVDYASYVIAQLTRDNLNLDDVANFNLDADRGYGYLTWDWVRLTESGAFPGAFFEEPDPSVGLPNDVSQHKYEVPKRPGYGWNEAEVPSGPTGVTFNPDDATASVLIRYIGKEEKHP